MPCGQVGDQLPHCFLLVGHSLASCLAMMDSRTSAAPPRKLNPGEASSAWPYGLWGDELGPPSTSRATMMTSRSKTLPNILSVAACTTVDAPLSISRATSQHNRRNVA